MEVANSILPSSSFSKGKKPDSAMIHIIIIDRHYLCHQEHDDSVTAVMMTANTTASSGDDEAGTTTTVATTTTIAATTTTDGFEWADKMTTPPPTSTSQQQQRQQRPPIAKEQGSNPRPYTRPLYLRPTSPPKMSGPRSTEADFDIPTSHKKHGGNHVQTEHELKVTAPATSPTVEETRHKYWSGGGFESVHLAAQNSQRKFWGWESGSPWNPTAPVGALVHTPPKGDNQAKKKHRVDTHTSPTPPTEAKPSEFFGPSPSWATKSDREGDSVGVTTPVYCRNTCCPRFYENQKNPNNSDECEICFQLLSTPNDTPLRCGETPRPAGKYS